MHGLTVSLKITLPPSSLSSHRHIRRCRLGWSCVQYICGCVLQLLNAFPAAFEFNEAALICILDAS